MIKGAQITFFLLSLATIRNYTDCMAIYKLKLLNQDVIPPQTVRILTWLREDTHLLSRRESEQ